MNFSSSSYSFTYKKDLAADVKTTHHHVCVEKKFGLDLEIHSTSSEDEDEYYESSVKQEFPYFFRRNFDYKDLVQQTKESLANTQIVEQVNLNPVYYGAQKVLLDFYRKAGENLISKQFDICKDSSYGTKCNLTGFSTDTKNLTNLLAAKETAFFMPRTKRMQNVPFYNRVISCQNIMLTLPHDFNNPEKLINYYLNGVNLFKIDLKYGVKETHLKTLKAIAKARRILKMKSNGQGIITVGLQLSSRKFSTGSISNQFNAVLIDRESKVILTPNRSYSYRCNHKIIYINFQNYIGNLKVGDLITIGTDIILKVIDKEDCSLHCRSLTEGLLVADSPVYLPKERILMEFGVTAEEQADLELAMTSDVDFLIFTCLHKSTLPKHIRWELAAHKKDILLIAKLNIEDDITVKHLDRILEFYHGIFVIGLSEIFTDLRDQGGDKMTEVNSPEMNEMYRIIAQKCFKFRKILIREHMNLIIDPSDEENIAYYYHYADCVVIKSNEKNDEKAFDFHHVRKLVQPKSNLMLLQFAGKWPVTSVDYLFIRLIVVDALLYKCTCIIVINNNGNTVWDIAQCRPVVPIIACFSNEALARFAAFQVHVHCVMHDQPKSVSWHEECLEKVIVSAAYAKRHEFIIKDEPFIVVFDSIRGLKRSDSYKIVKL